MRRIVWAEQAKQDLAAIEAYWANERPDFVETFYRSATRATVFLSETPGAGSPLGLTRRRKWRIGRTPYLLIYRFTKDTLHIARVRHHHENWRDSP